MSGCIFCRIVAGELPASVVYEDDHTLAFMDLGSVNPGHVLVATRTHVDSVFGLDDALAGAVFRATAKVARASREAFGAPGMNLFQASGAIAGQTVFHFHMHVLPRREGDGMRLEWPAKNPSREQLQAHAAKIRAALDAGN